MKKEWKMIIGENCPNCGDNLEVLSECLEKDDTDSGQWFVDGEDVKCCGDCGFESAISVVDGEVWIQDGNINELNDEI